MNFYIRPATSYDIPFIHQITLDGINTWGSEIYDNLKPWVDSTCSLKMMEKKFLAPKRHAFIAEKDDELVGTIYIDVIDDETVYMGGLYCTIKKCGLGSALLEYVMAHSIEKGYTKMSCEIYENNVASISLMKKYGAYYMSGDTVAGATYDTYCFDLLKVPLLV